MDNASKAAVITAIITGIFTIIAAIITHSPSTEPSLTGMITKDYLVGSWEHYREVRQSNLKDADLSFYPSGNFEITYYTYYDSSRKIFDTFKGTYQLTNSDHRSILTLTSSEHGVAQWTLNYIDKDHFKLNEDGRVYSRSST